MSERGSIFLETIVAAAIVAMILGATLESIASSARRTERATAASGALLVAQSRLAELGATLPVRPGTVQGTANGYRWRIEIAPWGSGSIAGVPYLVTVAVTAPGVPGTTMLRTIRLA